ncbi:Carbohydrate sulfotransferase 12 [Oryzias melastigma]|uniref:Carbohydrate sulfotransferase n=1 Tax=Oryzias melastigma TaxID=30732 RepID=A0A834BRH2_ORYME|nr:Carbohydrate sulfotransferase 12 [Oryzias melastigma]
MGLIKDFMAVFVLLGCMVLIFLTTNEWQFHQQFTAQMSTQSQKLRKDLLRKHCAGVNQSLVNFNKIDLTNFIVDDKNGIIYCYVPKVACTNWKRTLLALKHGEPYPNPMSFKGDWVHQVERFQFLRQFPLAERKAKLKHYTKFLFVRDPFVRLISAYRAKMLKHDQYFYDGYVRHILQSYEKQSNLPVGYKEAMEKGVHPSFHNFIQYIVDPRTERYAPFEPHWRQMFRMCHPCLVNYDLIGHQETLQEDAQELLKMLKLEVDIKFPPSYENMTSHNSITDWFQSVPLEDRRKLYKVYEKDFQLFGYRRPTELLDE